MLSKPSAQDVPRAAAPTATTTPAEQRLRRIIESAPVSLVVLSAEGRLMAGNRAALDLLGVERLDQQVNEPVDSHIVAEDRERFRAFVADVCRGQGGKLEYRLARTGGEDVAVETRAAPLVREDHAPAVFLGATWDVTAREQAARQQQQMAELHATQTVERSRLEQALQDAKAELERVERERDAERRAVGGSLAESRNRMQAALAEAEAEQVRLTAQWDAERALLDARIRESEARVQAAEQRLEERDERLQVTEQRLQAAEQRLQEGDERLRDSVERLRAGEDRMRKADEQMAALSTQLASERDAWHTRAEQAERIRREEVGRLQDQLRELERRFTQIAEDQQAGREEIERMREAERVRAARALDNQQQWRLALTELLRPVGAISAQVERMLDDCATVDSPQPHRDPVEASPAPDEPQSAPASPAQDDSSWEF